MGRSINHRQLEAFQAVIEAGTVTVAAERLFITQPAVSRLIKDLEHALGLTLFERRRGRLMPTVEAQVLYEEVERSFAGLDKIQQLADDIRTLEVGTLRIAAMPALALGFLPRIIKQFSELHAGVSISWTWSRPSCRTLLECGSAEYGVGTGDLTRHFGRELRRALQPGRGREYVYRDLVEDAPNLGVDLFDAVWEAGNGLEVGPGCPNFVERSEGGLLSHGDDMTRENNPFECGVALAVLERGYWNPGQRIEVETPDGACPATVSPLSFPSLDG